MATYRLRIGYTGLPDWLAGMAIGEYKELLNTKLSDQPGIDIGATSGKQDAWCGFHADVIACILYSAGQGGHADYHGSEVDGCNLLADTPAWTQRIASAPESVVTPSPTYSPYYSDGTPSSVHGYYSGVFINSINRCMRLWGGATSDSGNPMLEFTAFNTENNTWDEREVWESMTLPDDVSVGASIYAYAKHPITEVVYCYLYNSRIVSWTPGLPGAITTLLASPPGTPAPSSSAAAICPELGTGAAGIMFILGGGSGGTMCHKYDIGNPSAAPEAITLTGTNIATGDNATYGGISLEYSSVTGKFYAVTRSSAATSSVYEITPTSGTSWACSLLSTTGASVLPATNDETNGAHSPYTKAKYFPRLGVLILGLRWGGNLIALKIHEV